MSTIARIITPIAIVTVSTLSLTILSGATTVSAVSQVPDNASEQAQSDRANERSTTNGTDQRTQQDNNRSEGARDSSQSEQADNQRLELCEKRLEKIELTTETISTRATEHMAVFGRIHDRVETFYDTSPLDDPDYNDLNTAVVSARDAATTELELFRASTSDITCIGENPLLNPTKELRMRAMTVIEALQTYRSTLVQLIQSLRAEIADAQSDETSEDDQSANEQRTD